MKPLDVESDVVVCCNLVPYYPLHLANLSSFTFCQPCRELAQESGIANWGRVPALNTNSAFIDDLADAVIEALPYVGRVAGPADSLVPIGE